MPPRRKWKNGIYMLLAFFGLAFAGWLGRESQKEITDFGPSRSAQDHRESHIPPIAISPSIALSPNSNLSPAAPVPPPAADSLPSSTVPNNIFEVQVALARHGISSGPIDGVFGSQTRAALLAFQNKEHLPITAEPDFTTKARLAFVGPVLATYTLTSNDFLRLLPVGKTWLAKSEQNRLDYETILEMVAEKGHAHPSLIRLLNASVPWTNWSSGMAVAIPNVLWPEPRAKAAFVTVRLGGRTLQAFDAHTNLLAHFPCSIARQIEKRPVGQLHVAALAANPNYVFDPDIFPESDEGKQLGRRLVLPPGPNNPVGTVWIGLDKPGYGIHGTPKPEDVGRTESHGCFRLANWNAEYLLKLVWVGMPVLIEP